MVLFRVKFARESVMCPLQISVPMLIGDMFT
jgi:hypothetical protein